MIAKTQNDLNDILIGILKWRNSQIVLEKLFDLVNALPICFKMSIFNSCNFFQRILLRNKLACWINEYKILSFLIGRFRLLEITKISTVLIIIEVCNVIYHVKLVCLSMKKQNFGRFQQTCFEIFHKSDTIEKMYFTFLNLKLLLQSWNEQLK